MLTNKQIKTLFFKKKTGNTDFENWTKNFHRTANKLHSFIHEWFNNYHPRRKKHLLRDFYPHKVDPSLIVLILSTSDPEKVIIETVTYEGMVNDLLKPHVKHIGTPLAKPIISRGL